MWFPMSMAPTTGEPFVHLRRTIVVGGGKPPRVRLEISSLHRHRYTEEGRGFWRNSATSVADHAAGGWWAHSVPLDHEGKIRLPDNAFEHNGDILPPEGAEPAQGMETRQGGDATAAPGEA